MWFADFQHLSTGPSTEEVLSNNLKHGHTCILRQCLPLQHYVVDRTHNSGLPFLIALWLLTIISDLSLFKPGFWLLPGHWLT